MLTRADWEEIVTVLRVYAQVHEEEAWDIMGDMLNAAYGAGRDGVTEMADMHKYLDGFFDAKRKGRAKA